MCHNSGIESEQIERYMAFGLPQKAVRSVKYTMRKREQQQRKEQQKQQNNSSTNNNNSSSSSGSSSDSSDSGTDCDVKLTRTQQQQETQRQQQLPKEQELPTTATATANKTETEAASLTAGENVKTAEATTENEAKAESTHNNNSNSILQIPKFCGRFRKMQQQQQQQEQEAVTTVTTATVTAAAAATTTPTTTTATAALTAQQQRKMSSMEPSMDDALAIGTQMTRKFAERCHCLIAKLQGSRLYTILTQTTQPAHLIAICILSFVLLTVGPDLTTTTTTTTTTSTKAQAHNIDAVAAAAAAAATAAVSTSSSTLPTLAYLGAFATHFGSQIWMTFVSGLSLYFSLPRHTFGQCQQILFPKYFALNAMLSISMLIIYVKYFLSGWTTAAGVQLGTLALTAAIEVVVRLYLAPPMLRLMHEKYRIEGAIGSGQEVGSLVQGDLVECPHYQRIHKAFRRIHMTIAIGNMIILLATCLQLYFLALKIRIS